VSRRYILKCWLFGPRTIQSYKSKPYSSTSGFIQPVQRQVSISNILVLNLSCLFVPLL